MSRPRTRQPAAFNNCTVSWPSNPRPMTATMSPSFASAVRIPCRATAPKRGESGFVERNLVLPRRSRERAGEFARPANAAHTRLPRERQILRRRRRRDRRAADRSRLHRRQRPFPRCCSLELWGWSRRLRTAWIAEKIPSRWTLLITSRTRSGRDLRLLQQILAGEFGRRALCSGRNQRSRDAHQHAAGQQLRRRNFCHRDLAGARVLQELVSCASASLSADGSDSDSNFRAPPSRNVCIHNSRVRNCQSCIDQSWRPLRCSST